MKNRILILLVAVTLFALPSFAQREIAPEEPSPDVVYTGFYDLSTYLENPCTAEQDWVSVDYSVYVEDDAIEMAAGPDRFLFDESTTMGSSTYVAHGSSHSDVTYAPPFTLRKYHKVNTPDDFHVVTVIDFDPATRTKTLSVETACGNGLPDSAQ